MHDDLVNRNLTVDCPDRLRLADIAEHVTSEGKVYLCAIKSSVQDRRTVDYAIDVLMKFRLAVTLSGQRRDLPLLRRRVHYIDRGSRVQSRKFVWALKRHPMAGSIGRVEAVGHKVAIKPLLNLLQKNVLDHLRGTAGRDRDLDR
ncbi:MULTISPECIES: hypothetical protein [unclassified Streptomyces]|uniref:hypothetical protein n=1 Tax=unclassified Streptomyces TaxID=2593676 RepID=UPI00136A6A70|nr:hypothetical protein [Streptomyces sp. SID6139]MYR20715.1 hypothetical protein [Streptomyces sp. SID6137]